MIVHNDRPEDLESLLSYLNQWITPDDSFFVRQHLPRPTVDEAGYRLAITGRVSKELSLTLPDLQRLNQYTLPAVLECTGNARGFFAPRVPGIQLGAWRHRQRRVKRSPTFGHLETGRSRHQCRLYHR